MRTVPGMAALRLVLAAIVASATAPVIAAAAPADPSGWKLDEGCGLCDAGLALSCDVRAALAQAVATPLTATPAIALRPPVRTAVGILFDAAPAPVPAAVLPDAPKTSPPA